MKKIVSLLSLALCASAVHLVAAPAVIGVARSWGAFYVNNASVPGSATVFDGASLRTAEAASNLNLTGGERVLLSSQSAATIFAGRLQLDRGMAEFGGSAGYRVEARNLRVETLDSAARIRVGIDRQNRVIVASMQGPAEVRNSRGNLLARIAAGGALTLSASSPDSVELTGIILMKDGKYYLVDDATKVQVELRGDGLKDLIGKHAQIAGKMQSGESVAAGAPQVVIVEAAKIAAAAAGAASASAGAATAAGVASTISTSTIASAGAVVAAGGTMGGLAATGVIGSQPSVSR